MSHPRRGINAHDLLNLDLPDTKWIIPGLLTEGLTLLAGRPKSGKSWMAMDHAVSVGTGGVALGRHACPKAGVMYLALEDNVRRGQRRLKQVLNGAAAPDGLYFFWEWPALDHGGLDELRSTLKTLGDVRLLIVDTLAKVRAQPKGHGNVYHEDYQALSGLKKLADELSIAILVVHHTRKADAEDVFDTVSGSTGLTGCADTLWVLERGRGRCDAILHATGRDIEESETALNFDSTLGLWTVLGGAAEYRLSQERAEIINVLKTAPEPLGPSEIADRLGKKVNNIKFLLGRMLESGAVVLAGRGKYHSPLTSLSSSPSFPPYPDKVSEVSNVSKDSEVSEVSGGNREGLSGRLYRRADRTANGGGWDVAMMPANLDAEAIRQRLEADLGVRVEVHPWS